MSFFVRPRPQASSSVRVIAFHHAGGSAAMYHPMSAELPADWELLILDLPGRGKRYAQDPISTFPALVARVVEDVRPWLDVPVALFGHSLGALLAAEVGRVCEGLGAPPVWVGVSGRVAPSLQAQARPLNTLGDAALLAEIRALGGTPERIDELPELRERFLRIVRADIAVLSSARSSRISKRAQPNDGYGPEPCQPAATQLSKPTTPALLRTRPRSPGSCCAPSPRARRSCATRQARAPARSRCCAASSPRGRSIARCASSSTSTTDPSPACRRSIAGPSPA